MLLVFLSFQLYFTFCVTFLSMFSCLFLSTQKEVFKIALLTEFSMVGIRKITHFKIHSLLFTNFLFLFNLDSKHEQSQTKIHWRLSFYQNFLGYYYYNVFIFSFLFFGWWHFTVFQKFFFHGNTLFLPFHQRSSLVQCAYYLTCNIF